MRLLHKELLLDQCPVLWHKELTKDVLASDFEVRGGRWTLLENGWLLGENPGNFPGMIISRENFPGDVVLAFTAATVAPSTHDINAMWNGSWDYQTNTRGVAYVGGLEGWWHGKVGFEKSPDYRLNAANPNFDFHPGQEYRIHMGSINGHAFILVDGKLVLEVTDPDPIDSDVHGRFGFEAYCSKIRIRDVYLLRAVWNPVEERYEPEF